MHIMDRTDRCPGKEYDKNVNKDLNKKLKRIGGRILRSPYWISAGILLLLILIFNLLAMWKGFCDFYTAHITPVILNTYGRFTGLFPFSVGEILIVLGLLLIAAALILGILLIFLRKKAGFRRFCRAFYKTFLMILLSVALIMTLNCSIPYGCSDMEVKGQARAYTVGELEILRNYLVEKCNAMAAEFPRDDKGRLIYDPDLSDLNGECRSLMQSMEDEYPRLSGYYPDMKPVFFSSVMSQSRLMGIFFPFSMEANYNTKMYITNHAFVFCHEYAHLKGYMQEDEANYLAFRACLRSEDPYVVYSGYLGVLNYVQNAYYDNMKAADPERYKAQPSFSEHVKTDDIFLTKEAWEEVEETSIFNTDTMGKIHDDFTNGYMHYYGIEDGIASYGRVTDLLLQYYDGTLY